MTTISAPDLTLLRTGQHQITPYLSVLKPDVLLTARVNDGTIVRGQQDIDYDTGSGSLALFVEGITVWAGSSAGARDKGRVRLKSNSGTATAGTLLVDENGIDWADNDYLTVYHNFEIWPAPPRIDAGIFYKFYNTPYLGQNLTPSPVAIAGPHRAGFLASGSLVFSVDATDSYAIASGATITDYLWAAPSGGTIGAATSASTTITFTTAGQYWVSLTVTDSNSQTQITWRCFFVYSTASPPETEFSMGGLSGDWSNGGWQVGIEAFGDVTLADFPDGSLCVLWCIGKINGVEDYVNIWGTGDNTLMTGYIQQDQDNDSLADGTGEVSFSIATPEAVLDKITESGTIALNAVPSPTTWYQYASWLTVGRSIHHELKWHSTAMETMDVYGLLDNVLGVKNQDFTEGSILQRCNGRAADINAKLVSDRLGRLHLVEDTQMLNTAARAALDTVFTIGNTDISGSINIPRQQEKIVAVSTLDGFAFDGNTSTAVISIIPAYRPSSVTFGIPEFQGTGAARLPGQVLTGQTDANERVGRLHAASNNPIPEIRITNPGNYLGAYDIVPSLGFYAWGISNATLKRAIELNGINTICRHIEASHSSESGTLTVSVVFETEALGPDGIVGNYPTTYPEPGDFLFDPPPAEKECEWAIETASFDTAVIGVTMKVAIISDTQAVACYVAGAGNLRCVVLDWSGALTAGTPITIEVIGTSAAGGVDVKYLDVNTVVVSYYLASTGPKAVIVTVSGTTPTAGTPVLLDTVTTTSPIASAPLDTTTVAFIYGQPTGNKLLANAFTVSGSVITVDALNAVELDTGIFFDFDMSLVAINETVCAAQVSTTLGGAYPCEVIAFSVADGLVNDFGVLTHMVTFSTIRTSFNTNKITRIDDTTFAVVDAGNSDTFTFIGVCSLSGLAITLVDFTLEIVSPFMAVSAIDAGMAQIMHWSTNDPIMQTFLIDVDGVIQVNDDAFTLISVATPKYGAVDSLAELSIALYIKSGTGYAALLICG